MISRASNASWAWQVLMGPGIPHHDNFSLSFLLILPDKNCVTRLDQAPLHSGSGVRQLGGVSVVPDKCSGAKERSVGAENGSRLQAGPALTKISNCQFKFNSFQVQIDRFKYIMPMTLVHNNIY